MTHNISILPTQTSCTIIFGKSLKITINLRQLGSPTKWIPFNDPWALPVSCNAYQFYTLNGGDIPQKNTLCTQFLLAVYLYTLRNQGPFFLCSCHACQELNTTANDGFFRSLISLTDSNRNLRRKARWKVKKSKPVEQHVPITLTLPETFQFSRKPGSHPKGKRESLPTIHF